MPFSLLQSLGQIPLAFVDVETTGTSADLGDRIIEIGIVRYENGRKVAEHQQLINPQRRISPGVTALTGIDAAIVEDQPTFAEQLDSMMLQLGGAVVVGHNIGFDLSFLNREFCRCGRDVEEALQHAPVLDTVRIARRRFGRGGNGLQRLCRRLGYEPDQAHRALADAVTTAIVFEKLIEPVGGWNLCLCDAMVQQGGPMKLVPAGSRRPLLPVELEEAIESRSAVVMEYLDGDEQRTNRIVQPLHIRRRNGELVLVAHCQLRNRPRTFKLERIVQLTRLADTADVDQTLTLFPISGGLDERATDDAPP